MERLLAEVFEVVLSRPSAMSAALWVSFVSLVVWAPVLFPPRLKGVAGYISGYGLVSTFLCFFSLRLLAPPFQLLELVALGTAALWVWLEGQEKRGKKVQEGVLKKSDILSNPSQIDARQPSSPASNRPPQDILNAVRIALWATLALIPLVHWA